MMNGSLGSIRKAGAFMSENKTSVFSNGLLWFGAGISIAEILTGMLLAPLGLAKGLLAILIGHVIGGAVMFGAGLIGGRTGKSAMETVAISFGHQGARLFAGLNVIQLIGWTAVMIASAAAAANTLSGMGSSVWSVIIGAFIALWIVLGLKNLGKVNVVVIAALLLLTLVLSGVIFMGDHVPQAVGDMTLGATIEAHGGYASFLASCHFRLYPHRGETFQSNGSELPGLLCRKLLDVHHRYGRRSLYRAG